MLSLWRGRGVAAAGGLMTQPLGGVLAPCAAAVAGRELHLKAGMERKSTRRRDVAFRPRWRPPAVSELHATLPARQPEGRSLVVEPVQGARVVYLNKPKASNTLDYKLLRQLRRNLIHLEDNDRVRAVVLRGSGDNVFSVGTDWQQLAKQASDPATRRQAVEYFREQCYLTQLIASYTKPIVSCAHGMTLGSAAGLARTAEHMYASQNTVYGFPKTSMSMVPTGGASFALSRLSDGLGLYLGLTNNVLRGDDVYWAGVADFFAPTSLLSELPEGLGHLHSFAAWDHIMEHDPTYRRNLEALREARGAQRWNFVVDHMPEGTNREALEGYVQDKEWYNNLGEPAEDNRGRPPLKPNMDIDEKGDLFDFGAGHEVDGWDQLPEPLTRVLQDKNTLGCSAAHAHAEAAGLLDDGPSPVLVHLLDMVKRCFGGDPSKGDPVLEVEAPPVRKPRTREQWLAAIQDRALPPSWQESLPVTLRDAVTDVYVAMHLAPNPLELEVVLKAVEAAVPRGWPLGVLDDVRLDDLCHEFKVPDRKELYDVVQGSLTLITARLHGIPPGPLVHPERLARQRQEMEDAAQRKKHFSDQGKELSPKLGYDPADVNADDVLYHLHGTEMDASSVRPLRVLPEDEMESRLPMDGLEELGEEPYDPLKAYPTDDMARERKEAMQQVERYLARRGVSHDEARRLLADMDGFSLDERHKMPKPMVAALDFLDQMKESSVAAEEDAAAAGSGGGGRDGRNNSRVPLSSLLDALPDGDNHSQPESLAAILGNATGPTMADLAASSDEEEGDDEMFAEFKRKAAKDAVRRANSAEEPTLAYLQSLTKDPVKLVAGLGLPRAEVALGAAADTVQAFKDEEDAQYAPPMARSVEEIFRRLQAEDTPLARDTIESMLVHSPLALRATHRLIVHASTRRSVEDCLPAEFRVATRMLERDGATAGSSQTWSVDSTVDADEVASLFEPLPPYEDLKLPVRSARLVTEAQEEELEEWKHKLETYLESGEAQGVVGNMMKKRYVWW